MPDFIIKFIGHIHERHRSENFPHDIVAIGTYRVENNREIARKIQEELMAFIGMQGMIVQLDPAATVDMTKLNTEGRVFVPMHMIAYIYTEVINMTPMPGLLDTGEKDKDGKSIVEYQSSEGKKILPS
jgi:hypothetical protein